MAHSSRKIVIIGARTAGLCTAAYANKIWYRSRLAGLLRTKRHEASAQPMLEDLFEDRGFGSQAKIFGSCKFASWANQNANLGFVPGNRLADKP